MINWRNHMKRIRDIAGRLFDEKISILMRRYRKSGVAQHWFESFPCVQEPRCLGIIRHVIVLRISGIFVLRSRSDSIWPPKLSVNLTMAQYHQKYRLGYDQRVSEYSKCFLSIYNYTCISCSSLSGRSIRCPGSVVCLVSLFGLGPFFVAYR